MKIVLISYGDYNFDGRLRELIKAFSCVGELKCFCRGDLPKNQGESYKGNNYFGFIKYVVNKCNALKSIDVMVLDNRKATIPGLILKHILKPKAVIQDCRELYVSRDVKHLAGKLGCFFEKKMIEKADILICANEDRAEIMCEMYDLKEKPIVYENLRQLQYSKEEYVCKNLAKYIKGDEFRIISSSGCSVSRTNNLLVENIDKVQKKVRVFLVGPSLDTDIELINEIVKEKQLDNIEILGKLNQDELKWLIRNSHIGIVNYHQKDLNNKYCASGKLYEFIYEGIPVVTTTNPPLKRLCDKAHIGKSTDVYYDGINEVLGNYNYYLKNVNLFAEENTVENNNIKLIDDINERLKQCTRGIC